MNYNILRMKSFIIISLLVFVYIAEAGRGEDNIVPFKKHGQAFTINALNSPGVIGDGSNDDTKGIQSLLDAGASAIYLPKSPKYYKLTNTLRLHSDQTIIADQNAVIKLAERACKHLLTNADHTKGNEKISVIGGIWDGNNLTQTMEYHETGNWKVPYDSARYLGVIMQFNNVSDLYISNITLKDPETFGIQAGNLSRFTIKNITFDYNMKRLNMDGVHINGNSHEGRISNLKGATNDDLLALNADDGSIFEMSRGPITDIHVDGIWSNNGYRAVRLLSCGSPIERVKISNIFGSYKFNVIAFTNYNAHPGEESSFSEISIEGVFCSKSITGVENFSQISIEGPCYISNIIIRDYNRIEGLVMSDEISIDEGAVIDNMLITNANLVYKCAGRINFLNNHGKINNLTMNNISFKYQHGDIVNHLIKNKGSISSLNQWNISEDFQIH